MLALLAGCASPPPPQEQAARPSTATPACRAGTDSKGIAAAFFAFFQDRPECF